MVSSNDDSLRDSEVALMDDKTVFELMLNAGVRPELIDKLLASQSEQYPPDMPRAVSVFVMESLREFVSKSEREAHRAQVRRIREEPPAGSA